VLTHQQPKNVMGGDGNLTTGGLCSAACKKTDPDDTIIILSYLENLSTCEGNQTKCIEKYPDATLSTCTCV
jgi:hypothetical protein